MNPLWSEICRHARSRPGEPALQRYTGVLETSYTWSQLQASVVELAMQLRLDRIDVAALHGASSPEWVIVDLACNVAGVTLIPLPDFFSAEQLAHALSEVPVDAIFADPGSLIAPLNPRPLTYQGQLAGFDYLQGATSTTERLLRCQTVLPAGTQKVTFTSGSTGRPKGVCLSAAHQLQVADALLNATASCNIRRHLCLLPLSVLLENLAGVYAPLKHGASVVLAHSRDLGFKGFGDFSVPGFLRALDTCLPDSVILMPQSLQVLVAACEGGWRPPGSLQFIAVGGAAVSPLLIERALACGLPVYEGYGLSECGSVVSLNRPGSNRPGSLGKPLPHTEVRVVDGEFVVHGPICLGYASDRASWRQSGMPGKFKTGDLGWIDAEGFLHFEGRSKNLIITSHGRNISPEWLESELSMEPAIEQCFVFGDARPGCVALIVAAGAAGHREIVEAVRRVNEKLPVYAQLLGWHLLEARLLPGSGAPDDLMTSNGKPRRAQIAQRFADEIAALYAPTDAFTDATNDAPAAEQETD